MLLFGKKVESRTNFDEQLISALLPVAACDYVRLVSAHDTPIIYRLPL